MRIGIMTGGGDCPGLNAVIRAVTRHAIATHGWEVIGIEDAFRGLVERHTRPLTLDMTRGLLTRGGTILGTTNRANPFKYPVKVAGGREEIRDVSQTVLDYIAELRLDAVVAIGGDGTMSMARELGQRGARFVGVPKTIDNDLAATDYTFGFQTAVEVATEALDRLHTTAESHDRVMLCEVMGRYAGWIALASGIAGGADVILIPEMPYTLERVVEAIQRRRRRGIPFAIVVVSEGARPEGGQLSVLRQADPTQQEKLGGAAERLGAELGRVLSEHDVRVTVLGHIQRGGTPSAFDRLLATRYGTAAVELVREGGFGRMVTLRGNQVGSVSIAEACGHLKLVQPDDELVKTARDTGVELGS